MQLKISPAQLLVSEENFGSPFVTGFFKPLLVFPKKILEKLKPEEIKVILIHELNHIQRRDIFWNFILETIKRIFFFNIFYTHFLNKYYLEQEKLCDLKVCQTIRLKSSLATALTKLQLWKNKQSSKNNLTRNQAAFFFTNSSNVFKRLKNIKNFQHQPKRLCFQLCFLILTIPLNHSFKFNSVKTFQR